MKNKFRSSKTLFDEKELSLLCHQFGAYLKSGVSPLEGIPLVAEDIKHPDIKSSLLSISDQTLNGTSLSQAFNDTGRFPNYMIKMIEIGEKTGMLDTVMENLSLYYETESDIKKSIKNAIVYPSVLALLMLGVIALLIFKIIPMFGEILGGLGGQIPDEAQIIFAFANNLKFALIWFLCILLFGVSIFMLLVKIPKGRIVIDRLKVSNVFSGSLYKKIIASRLGQGLCLTLQSGMNIIKGFQAIYGLTDNTFVNEELKKAGDKISEGVAISEAMKDTGIFPEMFIRMIRAGERSGNLDKAMEKLSRIYARDAELSLRRLSSSVEPVMVTVLSLILGIILLSVLLPLISIMSTIG